MLPLRESGASFICLDMDDPKTFPQALPPRFDVSRTDIAGVVAAFYTLVRQHPVLGPVFARHVDDWTAHEEKIIRFWANAILHERSYDGNPQRVHVEAKDVRSLHFDIWLKLFDDVLHRRLPPQTADAWSALAHRIGRGLRMGVSDRDVPAGSAPKLF